MAKYSYRGRAGASSVEKPTLPFVLVLVGAMMVLLSGIMTLSYLFANGNVIATLFVSKYMFGLSPHLVSTIILGSGALGVMSGLILILVSIWVKSRKAAKANTAAILGLAFALLSLLNGGGMFIGFILAFIGSVLALVYPVSRA